MLGSGAAPTYFDALTEGIIVVHAGRVVRLIEALEDLDDVQSVYTTANLRNAAL